MDGVDASSMWKIVKQRLGLKGMGCCGATWSPAPSTLPEQPRIRAPHHSRDQVMLITTNGNAAQETTTLAMALEAERNSREGNDQDGVKTLMRLIEETDGVDWKSKSKRKRRRSKEVVGSGDGVCCVCMDRSKGAAFIPCGHTFCRVCSRELWVNRGCCPICNRSILEILDLF